MGCKACEQRRQKALETRRRFRDEKVARLTEDCDEGDASACRVLRSMLGTEAYDRENKFRSELHRLMSIAKRQEITNRKNYRA